MREALPPTRGGAVAVDVYVDGGLAAATRALRGLGMRVEAVSRRVPQRVVEGRLPVGALADASRLDRVRAIVPVEGGGTNAGSVASEGDAAHQGPQARAFGPAGAGVVVGIVSDSIDNTGGGVAGSQASGDLPADVQVLDDGAAGGRDEGRAMAEIVYDTAPAIPRMVFHTGTGGAANRAAGIDELVAAGADVIADDTFQITEPFFQDGVVAQAVDRARAAGVTYVVSAGNRARQSWEGTYSNSGGAHDFGGGDTIQTVGTFSSDPFISLQWDEPWGAAQTDLAVDVYNLNDPANPVFGFTTNTNNVATGLPREFVQIDITGTVRIGIRLRRVTGTREPFMRYIVGGVPTFAIAEHGVSAGAIDPDASSALGALTVGAVNHASNATPESFSSRGPAFRLFDDAGTRLAAREVRPKPDLAGADGVMTSVTGFKPFFGTSAAAPSVAGVAALIRSVDPALTPDQVAAALKDPAGAVECAGTAEDCGAGFPLADVQVKKLDGSPPGVEPVVSPAAPTGRGGFYTGPLTVSWNVADAASPIYASTGCGPTPVAGEGSISLTCSARSLGGTFTRSVTVLRDASPPSAPVIAGISATRFRAAKVPSAITCSASDATSGATCSVSGRRTAKGAHTITATATNGAGLTSISTLAYRVATAVTKVTVRRKKVSYTLDSAAKVAITVTNRGKAVRTLKQSGKKGNNARGLPELARGRYRVTVTPAGGFARTISFKRR